jgi:hypothetical protein
MAGFSPEMVENEEDLLLSGRATVCLLALRLLGKPLLQNVVFMHGQLERGTEADMRFDFGLGFPLEPRQVFRSELCDKQVKPEFLLALFQPSQGGQFLFELLIPAFLGVHLAAFVALRRINVASAELGKEKSVRVLDRLSVSFFRRLDARVRDIEKILEVVHSIEFIEVWEERAWMEILESVFENESL